MGTRVCVSAALVLCMGCAHSLVRMEPRKGKDQEVKFQNDNPTVYSRGDRFGVVLTPVTGPTGRYLMNERIGLIVGVGNRSDKPIEVSEASLSVTAGSSPDSRDKSPAQVVRAVEIEDSIRSDEQWAHALTAFDGAMQSANATGFWERRAVAADVQAQHAQIRATTTARLGAVSRMFQRNTIDPGDQYFGGVVIEVDRRVACPVFSEFEQRFPSSRQRPSEGPCSLRVSVSLDGEIHQFDLDELLADSAQAPPAPTPIKPRDTEPRTSEDSTTPSKLDNPLAPSMK